MIYRWRKQDEVFQGKYRQGITPKRPFRRQTQSKDSTSEEEEKQPLTNPFAEITAQNFRKPKANSHSPSTKTGVSRLTCSSMKVGTPLKSQSGGNILTTKIHDQSQCKPSNFWHQVRGKRFQRDYEACCLIGQGNFGSVVKCTNRLDGL